MKAWVAARRKHLLLFFILLFVEVFIALSVHDRFIRPYGGDVLVTVLLCAFGRIFLPERVRLLPFWVFLFSVLVEVGQYFDFVSLLGLGSSRFFSILLGSTFSFADIFCYGAGCLLFFFFEERYRRKAKQI